MRNVDWLTVMMVVPLVGALIMAILPRGGMRLARPVALGTSLVVLVLAMVAWLGVYDSNAADQFQLRATHEWIPQWGVSYALGVDGMAMAMIVMSAILVPICILAAWEDMPEDGERDNGYFAWILVLEAFMVGVFSAVDVFLFYVFFEGMLIPVYFLIASYGVGEKRRAAALKFLLFSLAGGLVMLAAVIGVYVQGKGGSTGFLVSALTGLQMDQTTERLLFVGFFVAFAIKAPMVPVHTWLPDAAEAATPATSTLLVGVLDKVGTFGMIRFCLQLFPNASQWATPVVIGLALISIVYGGVAAIGQKHMMRLVAFTSVSHFGFIVLGIFAFTRMSGQGSVLYMLNHGFSTAALFLVAGMLIQRRGSALISEYGGWQRVTPVLAGCFLIAGLSGLALPGLASFASEFLVMMGTFQRYPWVAGISSIGIILAALYILLFYQRVFTGPPPGRRVVDHGHAALEVDSSVEPLVVRDLGVREKLVMAPLIAIFVILGFYPNAALQVINPAVEKTLSIVGATDPAPAVGSAGATEGSAK
ncbi:NADH-quinone oxidoreductase subunit M [Austwickia sp. TVS 96-490-7B]|uniref:NADH-quinone oxidoreductase subunit M n=1 Tax=Austwickia sp. TVS 96-490-7B TaxID=2830843 RepID=UPI001C5799E5|nr:NADH-quinone oxidoreductase subunit M [Austwickia sp. TVS 96-490-7B]MBW3085676.1 NADH-quinone oxidoreductase subunit M [Austwickia sp. TVS 96-490-7B]